MGKHESNFNNNNNNQGAAGGTTQGAENTGLAYPTAGQNSQDESPNGDDNSNRGSNSQHPDCVSNDCHSLCLSLAAHSQANIPKTWVLLDNEATINIFSNPSLLQTPPKQVNTTMRVKGHSGTIVTSKMAKYINTDMYGFMLMDASTFFHFIKSKRSTTSPIKHQPMSFMSQPKKAKLLASAMMSTIA